MNARHRRVGPRIVTALPRGDDPALAVGGARCDKRLRQLLVVVALHCEASRALQHHAILHAQVGELLRRAVLQPQLHLDGFLARSDGGAEGNAVRQSALVGERAVGVPRPFERRQLDALFIPNGVDVRVRKIGEPKVGPERLRHIDDHVADGVPRREDAHLGFALWGDGAFEEAEARMPSAGIGQHANNAERRWLALRQLTEFKRQLRAIEARDLPHLIGR